MKSKELEFHERLLKAAKENLKSAKKGDKGKPVDKDYIKWWQQSVNTQQKKVDALKKKQKK